jgi:hypothetical protein
MFRKTKGRMSQASTNFFIPHILPTEDMAVFWRVISILSETNQGLVSPILFTSKINAWRDHPCIEFEIHYCLHSEFKESGIFRFLEKF